jgi:hypothetical protein
MYLEANAQEQQSIFCPLKWELLHCTNVNQHFTIWAKGESALTDLAEGGYESTMVPLTLGTGAYPLLALPIIKSYEY